MEPQSLLVLGAKACKDLVTDQELVHICQTYKLVQVQAIEMVQAMVKKQVMVEVMVVM